MRYSHKHKFVLVNNWKCGCSSICHMFDEYCEPCRDVNWVDTDRDQRDKCANEEFGLLYEDIVHAPASNIKKIFNGKGWNLDDYVTITSVRNPWARMVSLYFYLQRTAKKGYGSNIRHGGCFRYYPNKPDRETELVDFSVFARKSIPKWQGGILHRWNTYEMIHDDAGIPLIDYVVRLEHLEEDLNPIIEKHFPDFHMNYNIRENTTEHEHYSTYYDDESKSVVADVFSYDIDRWGYKFEDCK